MTEGIAWNHGQCINCWEAEHGASREPQRMAIEFRVVEVCCDCGRDTISGIYIRRDPKTVNFFYISRMPKEGSTHDNTHTNDSGEALGFPIADHLPDPR